MLVWQRYVEKLLTLFEAKIRGRNVTLTNHYCILENWFLGKYDKFNIVWCFYSK